jgi:protein-L-isoaspartate(D-aspartate) O-methyltransferase
MQTSPKPVVETPLDTKRARFNMIEQQVRTWEVLDLRVLDVLGEVPREDFVADQYRAMAFADLELPIGAGQHMLKPVIEGRMLQSLNVDANDEILEIGTGSGFTAACLSRLGRMVTTVERIEALAISARERLKAHSYRNVDVIHADALDGFVPHTRFDVIAVGAAVAQVPERFLEWLAPGGRLFVVRGTSPAQEALLLTSVKGSVMEESLFETDLPYLAGAAPQPKFIL